MKSLTNPRPMRSSTILSPLCAALAVCCLALSSLNGDDDPYNPKVLPPDDTSPTPPEPCCQECMEDGGDAETCGLLPTCEAEGSVFFSVSLGRTPFARDTSIVSAMAKAGKQEYIASSPQRSLAGVVDFYTQSPLTGMRRFHVWYHEDSLQESSFEAASLTADPGAGAERIGLNSAIRQILTVDYFADIQPLEDVRANLPPDIKSILQIPAGAPGFVIRTWMAGEQTGKVDELYGLPGSDPLGYVVFFRKAETSNPPEWSRTLGIIHRVKSSPAGYKTQSWTHQNNNAGNWVSIHYKGLPSGGEKLRQSTRTVTSRTSANAYVQSNVVKEASLSASGTLGSLVEVSHTEEKFDDIGGLKRLVRRTLGANLAASRQRTTQYGWINAPANAAIHGRPEWEHRPDGSFVHHTYSYSTGAGSGSIVTRRPWTNTVWTPGSTPPVDSGCVVETVSFTSRGNSMTSTRRLDDTDMISYEYTGWSTDGSGYKVLTRRTRYGEDISANLTETTGYHPPDADAHLANRIAWRVRGDGTAERYSYSQPDGNGDYTQTVEIGAGDKTAISKGRRAISERNARGYVTLHTEEWFTTAGGGTDVHLSAWAVDDVPYGESGTLSAYDFLGRPQGKVHNGNTGDYEAVIHGCCGVAYRRDRTGLETEYSRDELHREYKRVQTIGDLEVTTISTRGEESPYKGMVTETRRIADGLDLLVSERWVTTNGELDLIKTPDADGDNNPESTTYSYDYPGTGHDVGHAVTVTRPDGGTSVTNYFADGRIESITGSAVPNHKYDYEHQSDNGGGVVTTRTGLETSVDSEGKWVPTGEWIKTYADLAGRNFRVEYPTEIHAAPVKDAAHTAYYSHTDPAGSRGRVSATIDPDGVEISYEYDAEGNLWKITETMPGSAGNRVTETLHDATIDSTMGGALRTVTIVNGITTSTLLDAGDGYGRRENSFGRETLTTRTIASNGGWIELTEHPDASRTRRVFENGRLARVENRDNTTGDGNLVSETAYGYDDLGRLTSTYDSRTGTTQYTSYTESGNLLTRIAPGTVPADRTTTFEYDKMGRRIKVDAPNTTHNNITHTSYTAKGEVRAVWGDQTYPVHYQYDEQGRLAVMSTWRDDPPAGEPGAGETDFVNADQTSWIHHPQRGWLERKKYPDENGTDYEYTAAGRLKSRIWARTGTGSNRVKTTYGYDQGMLDTVTYANCPVGTPNLAYTYDAYGRTRTVTQGSAVTHTYAYKDDLYDHDDDPETDDEPYGTGLGLHSETVNYGTGAPARTIVRHEDGIQRPAALELNNGGSIEHAVSYGYDTAGRTKHVHPALLLPGSPDFTYHYEDDSFHLLASVVGPAHTVINLWDATRDVLDKKFNTDTFGTQTLVSSFHYTVNAIGQRTAVAPAPVPESDPAIPPAYGVAWTWVYNARGEVVSADHGSDSTDNAEDRFYQFDAIGNRDYIRNGVRADSGGTQVNYTANELNQYTGSAQNFIHDADGNLEEGALRFNALTDKDGTGYTATLLWDAENRLVEILDDETATVAYSYDYIGRRISRTSGATTTWYFYDGWNLIAEYTGTTHVKSYTWGIDLSGTMQGAGGVGGLLAVRHETETGTPSFYPCYDGNGNVTEYLDEEGEADIHFEYDPFGRLVASTDAGGNFPIRFSSKMLEDKSGLYYYGYRYYDPVTGRWPSRDPIEEDGGLNLYGFVGNDGVNTWDYLGLDDGKCCKKKFGGPSAPFARFHTCKPRDCEQEEKDCLIRARVVCASAGEAARRNPLTRPFARNLVMGCLLEYEQICANQKNMCEQWNANNGL